ncbi:MAG: site-specific DNA-methyltransferase, partial [Nitrospirota bacterium]|nr:site-specific DNA-methyltransferase [Nitrospirota bacterium]
RIISASTNEGDLVLDAFAGSGTTLCAAQKLGRKWIGIDSGQLAIKTIMARLAELERQGHADGFSLFEA